MSEIAARRIRILRLRTIEHRVAQAQLARADADITNLARIVERLHKLRTSLHAGQGATDGRALNLTAEMALRLDRAQISLDEPRREAAAKQRECLALQQHAHRKEDSIAKLHDRAVKIEAAESMRRSDANRPHRKFASNWGEYT